MDKICFFSFRNDLAKLKEVTSKKVEFVFSKLSGAYPELSKFEGQSQDFKTKEMRNKSR